MSNHPQRRLVFKLSLVFLLLAGSCSAAGVRRTDPPARLLNPEIAGFAGATTGGGIGPIRVITSLEDSGPGTLREAASRPGPARLRFGVSGSIELFEPVAVASDLTIDGRGASVTLVNKGLEISGPTSNVIVSDLRFDRIRGEASDGIQIRDGASDVWVTHCDFGAGDDGALDITRGATDVTVSWSRFHDHDKVMLVNGEEAATIPEVTLHHNFFDSTNQRNPRLVRAKVHAYNNYLSRWTGIGMQAAEDSELLSEGNVFEAGDDLDGIVTRGVRSGAVRSTGDLALNGAKTPERLPGSVFHPRLKYAYRLQKADRVLMALIRANAGPRDQETAPPG